MIDDFTLDLLVVSIVHSNDMLGVTVSHVEASARVVHLLILVLVVHLLLVHHLGLSLISFATRELPMQMVILPVCVDLVEFYVLQLLLVQSQLLLDDLFEEFLVQRLQHLLSFHVILAPVLVDGLWMRHFLAVGVDHLHRDCLCKLIVIVLIQGTGNFHLFLI